MLRRVENPEELRQAIRRRQQVAAGPADFNDSWIRENHHVVLAEETGRHVEQYEAGRLAEAIKSQAVNQLLAIVNDPLVVDEEVYEFETGEKSLLELSHNLTGVNVLVVPAQGSQIAVLFTVDDFRLIASSRSFFRAYVSDLATVKREFDEFADGHLDEMRPVLKRAAAYMSWIGLEAEDRSNRGIRCDEP